MATDYISLLNLTYEIEGLIMLHINRGEEASPEMTNLLQEKINRLAASMSETEPETDRIQQPTQPESVNIINRAEAPVSEKENDEYNDDFNESEPTSDQQAIATSAIVEETEDATPLRLEDKLARDRASDIFKAFTINDKFRFRRELFRNSQEEFDETLYVIAQMSNFDEAEEYFYNDLCWDPENEDVKEFMSIVRKHF